jgi:hypothetical protein
MSVAKGHSQAYAVDHMKTAELGGAGKSVTFKNFDLDNMLNLMQYND